MATSTYVELRTELAARGFDYLNATRLGNFINQGYTDICEAEDWPFLEASTSGTAPKVITDLRTIEYVVDSSNLNKLRPLDRRNLTDYAVDLTVAGTADYYYTTAGTTVNVYPADTTSTFNVHYWKVPTDLSADSDTPLIPSRFRSLIVDCAVIYAYEDDDEGAQADGAKSRYEYRLNDMKNSLMIQQHDEAESWVVTRDLSVWGGF